MVFRAIAVFGVAFAALAGFGGHQVIAWYIGAPVPAKAVEGGGQMCAVTFGVGGAPDVLKHSCDVPVLRSTGPCPKIPSNRTRQLTSPRR